MTKLVASGMVIVAVAILNACVVSPEIRSASIGLSGHGSHMQVIIDNDDRTLIRNYYEGRQYPKKKHKDLPPGLAKKKKLPPGLQKQLHRNGELPPGLKGRRLPHELEHKLSTLPKGYVRLIVDSDIVVINENNRVIVDLMAGIVL